MLGIRLSPEEQCRRELLPLCYAMFLSWSFFGIPDSSRSGRPLYHTRAGQRHKETPERGVGAGEFQSGEEERGTLKREL